MVHFYESSIITTKDGIHCQVYSNEHPNNHIIVKPKYIPMDKIESSLLPCRYIGGKRMNRLNVWIDQEELKNYLEKFKQLYPDYIYNSDIHKNWFFSVPLNKIEKVYDPKIGLKELLKIPESSLDNHLRSVVALVRFLSGSGISTNSLGVTYSTLMGHYLSDISDINIVVYGKQNYWKLLDFLKTASHPLLRWKTDQEWLKFREKRNRSSIFTKEEFLFHNKRKKSEGFFGDCLFVLFAVEEPDETWFKWGEETYKPLQLATVEGIVTNNLNSIVRPGYYEIEKSKIIGGNNVNVKKIVFHSRDYTLQAFPGEKIIASGLLEEVTNKNEKYHRLVIGYFDSYITNRRGKEYIKIKK